MAGTQLTGDGVEWAARRAPHPFRFGVTPTDVGAAIDWSELARQAEDLGYSTLLTSDHFVHYQPAGGISPMVALTWAAAVTTTLRVGAMVLGNDYRHPAIVAKEAATLDLLSGGRVELGLGAGWLRSDYEALGLRYDPPGQRVDRLADALEIINLAWLGETFDFSSRHYAISGYAASPKPVQGPRPPIFVGGGSRQVLRLAGRKADIVGIHQSTSPDSSSSDTDDVLTRRKVGWVREGAGERFGDVELQVMCSVAITDNPRAAAEALATRIGRSVDDAMTSAMALIGSVDEVCEILQQRREQWGISYIVIPAAQRADFAPVVARLSGS